MRFNLLVAFIVVLGLAVQTLGQVSTSSSPSWSISTSISGSGSVTGTYPTPPAPTGLVNKCVNHSVTICPEWSNPTGFTFNFFTVYYSVQLSGVVNSVTTNQVSTVIAGLPAGSLFDVWVNGVDTQIGATSANSTTVTFQTIAADPKNDPSLDIQNFACVKGTSSIGRTAIECSWTAAQDTVRQINFKVKCTSTVRKDVFIRKRLFGAQATATSAELRINWDIAQCNVYARFYYARRPTARHFISLTI